MTSVSTMSDVERQAEDSAGDEVVGGLNCSGCDGGVGGSGDATGCFSSSCCRPDGKVPTADPEPPATAGGSSEASKSGVGADTEAVPGASTTLDDVHDANSDPTVNAAPICCCGNGDGSCFCDDIAKCCVCPAFVPMPSSNTENPEISEEEARKRRIKYTICLISLILGIATVNLLLLLGLRFSSM